jgi:hypothetical protein
VLEIDEHFKPSPSSRIKAHFQLFLVHEDDHNCTRNVSFGRGSERLVGAYKYTTKISTLAFFCPRPNFIFFLKKLLGSTNMSAWHHARSKHPAEVGQCGIKPRNERELVLGDGTTAKCYSFDHETQSEQSTLLLKRLLAAYWATSNYEYANLHQGPRVHTRGT